MRSTAMDTDWAKSKETTMPSKRRGTGRKDSEEAVTHATAGFAESANPSRLDEIRLRAYEIYLERGERPGRELDDWLEAERQLKSDLS
jgi:hypothetical protein